MTDQDDLEEKYERWICTKTKQRTFTKHTVKFILESSFTYTLKTGPPQISVLWYMKYSVLKINVPSVSLKTVRFSNMLSPFVPQTTIMTWREGCKIKVFPFLISTEIHPLDT